MFIFYSVFPITNTNYKRIEKKVRKRYMYIICEGGVLLIGRTEKFERESREKKLNSINIKTHPPQNKVKLNNK